MEKLNLKIAKSKGLKCKSNNLLANKKLFTLQELEGKENELKLTNETQASTYTKKRNADLSDSKDDLNETSSPQKGNKKDGKYTTRHL